MRVRKILLLSLLIPLLCGSAGSAQVAAADAALAADEYDAADALRLRLGEAEARWRQAVAVEDWTALVAARRELEELSRQATRDIKVDLLPEIHLSLGFSFLEGAGSDRVRAWSHFEKALSYWAGDRRIDLARERYLSIIHTLARKAQATVVEAAPLGALQDALKIAQSPEDKAIGHFLLARKLSADPSAQQRARAGAEYSAAAEEGSNSEFLSEILFRYAQWAAQDGATNYSDQGELVLEPDYARAVSLYQKVVEAAPGSALAEHAAQEITAIRRPSLSVRIPNTFRPNTQAHLDILRRNVDIAELGLYPLALDTLTPQGRSFDDWLDAVDLTSLTPVYQARIETLPERPHHVASETVWIEATLTPGAYLASANGGGQSDRALLLVGEQAMVLKTANGEALVYFCDAAKGAPIPGATINLLSLQNGEWVSKGNQTGADGLVRYPVSEETTELVAIGILSGQFTIATHHLTPEKNVGNSWKTYPYAARDVYRVGETARWKALVRQDVDGVLKLPLSTGTFVWQVVAADESVTAEGNATLSDNGTLAGEVDLNEPSPLGTYYFRLLDSEGTILSEAPLLRVIENLPEQLTAEIQLQPSAQGAGYGPGETIRGTARLTYGFGGPVANAELELQVVETPLEEAPPQDTGAENDPPILHQALRSDSQGLANFEFPTIPNRDSRYLIELRAKDSTGLSARALRMVHVSQESVQVSLTPQKRLFLAGETVQVNLQAQDAEGLPLAVRGQVRLLRDYWREVWVDRRGREISGNELRDLEASSGGWFSFGPSPRDYRLKSEGYQTIDVTETAMAIDATGMAQFVWKNAEPGYYRLIWLGEESRGVNVRAVTSFWVAGENTDDIGYRPSTVRLIANEESVRPGEPFPVLIATPAEGRHVLVTGGRQELELAQVLSLSGTARLVRLTLPPSSESVHTLEATMVAEGTISQDRAQVVAAEAADQLQIKIIPSAERYSSTQSSEWTIQVSDGSKNPIAGAELSFSITSAEAKGQIRRPNPEEFFLPHREDALQSTSSLEQRPFFMPLRRSSEAPAVVPDEIFSPPQPMFLIEGDAAGVSEARTLVWLPSLVTDEQGQARVQATFPGISTDWVATARVVLGATAFGEAQVKVTTRLPLTARANLARLVQIGDSPGLLLTLSNHTSTERTATVKLSIPDKFTVAEGALEQQVTIPPVSDLRLSWALEAVAEGEGLVMVAFHSGDVSDEIERRIEVAPRRRVITSSRTYNGKNQLVITLPENIGQLSPQMEIRATPSLSAIAAGMAPDLLQAQRETTQETLLRFAPGLVVTGILRTLGYENEQINSHAGFGLTSALEAAANAGLESLRRAQRASGGWGWREGEPEDPFISAYTVILLTLAAEAGAEIPEDLLEKGRIYLGQRLSNSAESADRQAWQLLALAARYRSIGRPTRVEAQAMISIMRDLERLSAFGLAAVALAARDYGFFEDANVIVESLLGRVRRDEFGSAYWAAPPSFGNLSDFETTALALRAILVTQGPSQLSNDAFSFLLRKPPHTLTTREKATLVVILAQLAYETGEIEAEAEFDILLNGTRLSHAKIEPWSALSARYRWQVPASLIRAGTNKIEVKNLSARSPLVLSASAEWTPSGREPSPLPQLSVERLYLRTKLTPTLLRGLVEEVVELDDPGQVTLGDRLTSVITLKTTELARRVVVEDPRPPLAEVIGGGGGLNAAPIMLINRENPEQRIAAYVRHNAAATLFYIPDLPPGTWELRTSMRVESLGVFDVASVRVVVSPQNNDAATGRKNRLESRLVP